MINVGSMNWKLLADVQAFVMGTRRAAAAIKDTEEKTRKSSDGIIKSLKGAFGEESSFGGFTKILAGGGAVAGIALLARELEKATGSFIAIREQARLSGASVTDFSDDLVRTIPIIGSIRNAGLNLRSLFSGELTDDELVRQATAMQAAAQHTADVLRQTAALKDAAAAVGLEGGDKKRSDLERQYRQHAQEAREMRAAAANILDATQRTQAEQAALAYERQAQALHQVSLNHLQAAEAAEKHNAAVDRAAAAAAKHHANMVAIAAAIEQDTDRLRLNREELELRDAKRKDATAAELQSIKLLQQERTAAEAVQAANERAAKFIEDQKAEARNRQERVLSAAAANFDRFGDAAGTLPQALRAGSTEAVSALNRLSAAGDADRDQLAKAAVAAAVKQEAHQREILRLLQAELRAINFDGHNN